MKKLGYTIGFELEVEDIRPGNVNLRDMSGISGGFRTTHDASCESEFYSYNNIPVISDKLIKLNLGKQVFGTEIVSGLIDTENQYISVLKWLTNQLISSGESRESYRGGFHVHVNTPINLKILKAIMRLGRHLEQAFFLIGGMGYDYRGKKNDSTYCRPITKFGPTVVPIGNNQYGQCFVISDLLKSTSTNEFRQRYGDLQSQEGDRYIPVRYHWLNLVNLWGLGSLEFRIFNKSLNPHYLYAVIELCKNFTFYAIQSSFKSLKEEGLLGENSVYDIEDTLESREYIINTLINFGRIINIKEDALEILVDIMNRTPLDSVILPKEYVFSHLMYHPNGSRVRQHFRDYEYSTPKIKKAEVKKPEYVDIHVLRNENQSAPEFIDRIPSIRLERQPQPSANIEISPELEERLANARELHRRIVEERLQSEIPDEADEETNEFMEELIESSQEPRIQFDTANERIREFTGAWRTFSDNVVVESSEEEYLTGEDE